MTNLDSVMKCCEAGQDSLGLSGCSGPKGKAFKTSYVWDDLPAITTAEKKVWALIKF